MKIRSTDASLHELHSSHPIDPRWGEPKLFVDNVDIAGVVLYMCGFLVEDGFGRRATGSAAGLDGPPLARAYYELLERTSVLEAMDSNAHPYAVLDAVGRPLGTITCADLFPSTLNPGQLRYSCSNGVALAESWTTACSAAAHELIERDRILRSWYGEILPRRVEMQASATQRALRDLYDFEAYSFDPRSATETLVRGVFAFPKAPDAPLVYGFAAAGEPRRALESAVRECLQRLAFLWGESIPNRPPVFAPTAEYHQEVFLLPSMRRCVQAWLAGNHTDRRTLDQPPSPPRPARFANVTPARLTGLRIARALRTSELGLAFGRGHPQVNSHLPETLEVHPIA